MANIITTRPAPFGSIAVFQAVSAFSDTIESVAAWNRARKTRAALKLLSDEVLFDIGLDRDDIDRI